MFKTILILVCASACIAGYEITPIPIPKIALATRPVWDDATQSLYFINFLSYGNQPPIYRYSLAEGKLYSASIPGVKKIGFIYPVNHPVFKNAFAIGQGSSVSFITWDGKSKVAKPIGPKKLFSLETENPASGTDIVAADPYGRFYLGTFSSELCKSAPTLGVYRYDTIKGVKKMFGKIHGTSGLFLDAIAKKLIHLEYCSLVATLLDWDPATGDLSNPQVAFDFKTIGKTTKNFIPVGLAADTNGIIYAADFKRSVYIINPKYGKNHVDQTKTLLKTIDLGLTGMDGLAFGGPNRNILFVTAAGNTVNTETAAIKPTGEKGGSLFMITGLGVTGEETPSFKVPNAVLS